MKLSMSIVLTAGILCIPALGFAQESAGRVLVSAGDVTIARGAQKIPALAGTEVRAGDTLELGSQSNAQVRFTDESIVALRSDTSFRISEYAFQNKEPAAQRAFFNLIKGGMRTVTGLIGRSNHQSYGVQTPVATIGIRGTSFALCHDCSNPDGSVAQGTLGAVTEGRIGVINQTGEHQFGTDQYFQVTSAAAPPLSLLAPPPALRDALQGRTRAKPSTELAASPQEQQAAASVTAAVVAPAADTSISASVATVMTPPAALTTNVFQVTNQLATSTEAFASPLQPTFTGTVFYRLAGPFNNVSITCSGPDCGTPPIAGEITLGVNHTLQRVTIGAALQFDDGQIVNFGTPSPLSGIPITISGNQATFSATLNRVDFPENNGAFRCSDCGPNNGPGFFDQLSVSGVITGSEARVTLGGRENALDSGGSLTATLPLATPPNNVVAAMAIQNFAGGTQSRSAAFWNVQVDSSGRLLQFGPNVGGPAGAVGTASNVISGSDPTAGNLVWGMWTGPGAELTDYNYVKFTSTATGRLSVQPWITGDAPNTLPPSLGTLTYTPAGSAFTGATQRLNSASLTADFVNRSMSISLNATNTSGGNTYQMNGSTGFSPTSSSFASGFSTVTCTGPCNNNIGTADGSFGGFFAGAQAQGAGVAFSAGFGVAAVTGTAGNGVAGVVGFKR